MFVAQSRVIRWGASEKACVIVGRCADYILKDRPNTIHIFLFADKAHKVERTVAEYGISIDWAANRIAEIDKSRKEHYFHYTGKQWGDTRNYHATFDTGVIPLTQIAGFVENVYGRCYKS